MKKLWMLILCLGMIFSIGACDLIDNITNSNNEIENSESIENSGDSSGNGPENVTDDSSDENSSVTPPIIDGENEMPLVPIG